MLYEKYQIIICHDLYYTWFKLLPDTTVFYMRLISVDGGGGGLREYGPMRLLNSPLLFQNILARFFTICKSAVAPY